MSQLRSWRSSGSETSLRCGDVGLELWLLVVAEEGEMEIALHSSDSENFCDVRGIAG